MSDARDHGRWDDELAAYALGALEQAEVGELEGHLHDCDRCQERLRWLEPAVDVLPASVEQLEPPPELRERLGETVRGEAATARAPKRRRPGWLAAPRPAVALGTMAAVAAGVVGYTLHDGEESSTVALQRSGPAPRSASADLELDGDSGTLEVSDMPRPTDRGVYQVWVRHGHAVDSATVFVPDRHGRAAAAIPHGLAEANAVMVTREPAGGSKHPTGNAMLRASL